MPIVSVTRLRLRSILFLLPFAFRASASTRQALSTHGCKGARTRKTRGLAFWTLTLWDDENSMRSFVTGPPHRNVVPRLFRWCDEAAVAHWAQDDEGMPDWSVATRVLLQSGRLLRVERPSDAHKRGEVNVS